RLEARGTAPSKASLRHVAPRTDIPPGRLAPVQPPPEIPGAWGLPREQREKADAGQREIPPREPPRHVEQIVPPPVPATAATAFDVHETLPVELQQPPIIKTPIETVAAGTNSLAKGTDFKTD